MKFILIVAIAFAIKLLILVWTTPPQLPDKLSTNTTGFNNVALGQQAGQMVTLGE